MPRTPGTRVGNGQGHGGPARGGKSASKEGVPGPGRGVTHRTVAELMAAQGAREKAATAWMAILGDPTHPRHADMVAKAAERLDGAPEQKVTSEVKTSYVIQAPAEIEDEAAWARQHAPK